MANRMTNVEQAVAELKADHKANHEALQNTKFLIAEERGRSPMLATMSALWTSSGEPGKFIPSCQDAANNIEHNAGTTP